MNRKDRIAVVVSILLTPVGIIWFKDAEAAGLIILAPLSIYWSYRFIKNDISLLKMKDE